MAGKTGVDVMKMKMKMKMKFAVTFTSVVRYNTCLHVVEVLHTTLDEVRLYSTCE